MRNVEPESFSLNPEGFPVDMTAAQDMIDSLNNVTEGEKTDISSAKADLEEALKMHAGLERIQSVGPEVRATMTELMNAIKNLQQTIGGVD